MSAILHPTVQDDRPASAGTSSWFNRLILPGFAFKAVVIGGGYATGRELAEFFLPSGPRGGLLGMLFAAVIWSVLCTLTFLFARATMSENYRTFFRALLGPLWRLFDIAYLCQIFIVLSVFAAAAGAIGERTFGLPALAGILCLTVGIAGIAAFGSTSVERLFKYVTYFLYAVYAIFLVLMLATSRSEIARRLAIPAPSTGWITAGITYASYNVVGAAVILPVLRHMRSTRDAVIAGLLCGPLAMIPAMLFFLGMIAYYPEIAQASLPSDFILSRLHAPIFHVVFQLMIFFALLESGTGMVHAVNERLAGALATRRRFFSWRARLFISGALLLASVFVAQRFSFVALIATGYRALAYTFLAVFILPLLTLGAWRIRILRPLTVQESTYPCRS